MDEIKKKIGHLLHVAYSYVHHSMAISELKLIKLN